jgi:hypothetical protein
VPGQGKYKLCPGTPLPRRDSGRAYRGALGPHPNPRKPVLTAKIVGNKLVIEILLNAVPVASTSGKTLVVASTHGNKVTEAQVNGKNVVVGLNAYIPKG